MTLALDRPATTFPEVPDPRRGLANLPGPRVSLPFPEAASQIIRCPRTGAIAVACNARGKNHPDALRVPCYAVVKGHAAHGGHLWLTYAEALTEGWVVTGNIALAAYELQD